MRFSFASCRSMIVFMSAKNDNGAAIVRISNRLFWQPTCCFSQTKEAQSLPLVNVVLTLIVAGIILWLINTYVPMAGSIKTILNIVVVVAVCVWVLQAFGLWQSVVSYRVPAVH